MFFNVVCLFCPSRLLKYDFTFTFKHFTLLLDVKYALCVVICSFLFPLLHDTSESVSLPLF